MSAKKSTTSKTTLNKKVQRANSSTSTTAATAHHVFPSVVEFNAKAKPSADDVLIAYVHDMSQVKRNNRNTLSYCTFKLQTSATTQKDALLYSLSKRPLLIESESSRTPVKIKNFTFTEDKSKIVINDMTNITTPQQCEYSFQFSDISSPQNTATVLEVYNNHREWDTVTIRGKILNVHQPRTINSPKKRLKLMEAVIADQTGQIPLDLWESNIDQINEGSVYSLDNVQVRVWSSRKKLCTTVKTTIVPYEEPALANIAQENPPHQDEIITIVHKLSSIQKIENFLKLFQ